MYLFIYLFIYLDHFTGIQKHIIHQQFKIRHTHTNKQHKQKQQADNKQSKFGYTNL